MAVDSLTPVAVPGGTAPALCRESMHTPGCARHESLRFGGDARVAPVLLAKVAQVCDGAGNQSRGIAPSISTHRAIGHGAIGRQQQLRRTGRSMAACLAPDIGIELTDPPRVGLGRYRRPKPSIGITWQPAPAQTGQALPSIGRVKKTTLGSREP